MLYLRRVYIALACILTLSFSYGQINLDSLNNELEKLPTDTHGVNVAIQWGSQFKKMDLVAGEACLKNAYFKSKKIKYEPYISKSAINLGTIYGLQSDFGSSAQYLFEGLSIAEQIRDSVLIMKAYLSIGNMYSYNHQATKAEEMYMKALTFTSMKQAEYEKATILNNIGALMYRESGMKKEKIQKAISFFLNSVKVIEKLGHEEELVIKYNNLGLMYCDVLKHDSALYYLEKAKVIIDRHSNPDDLLTYYNFMGRIYADLGDFKKSEAFYLSSIEECKKLKNTEWIYETYLSLATLHESNGDFEKAYKYFKKYSLLKDSIVNVTNFAVAADIQHRFEREKKEAELKQLKAEQSRNKIFNIGLIIVSILVVISGIMMYSRFKIKAESEKKLKVQNEIISQKNKDITDSILYARKIQKSILPSEKQLEKELKRLIN